MNVQELIDACAQGGTVVLPAGTYDVEAFTIPDKVVVRGAGGAYGSLSATILRFPESTPICVHLAGMGAQLLDVAIQGPSLSSRAATGVRVSGHASLCRGVSVHFMTDFGFYVYASSADGTNANNFALEHCRAARCERAGYYVNGAETNAGRVLGCTADGNEGWGFFESSFLGNLYFGCHASNNTLGNYAQGGTIDAPTQGGVSNYSVFAGCYTEGTAPCPFRGSQVGVFGGNLIYQVHGWPDSTAAFPGQRAGYSSKLIFEDGPVRATVPSGGTRALANVVLTGDTEPWQLLRSWQGSPAWLSNTIALLQHDNSGWSVPYAATRETHSAGPGRRVYGSPVVSSPFRFVVQKSVSLSASPDWQTVELSAPLLAHDLSPASVPIVSVGVRETDPLSPGVIETGSHYIDMTTKKIRVRVRAVSGGVGDVVCDVERAWIP